LKDIDSSAHGRVKARQRDREQALVEPEPKIMQQNAQQRGTVQAWQAAGLRDSCKFWKKPGRNGHERWRKQPPKVRVSRLRGSVPLSKHC
jgi:hypothetical protein